MFDEHFFTSVVNAAPDGMLIVDRQGTIVFTNRQATELLGFGEDELVGQSVDVLLPSALQAGHRAHRTRYQADPKVRPMGLDMKLRARRKDGSEFPVEISLSPIEADGGAFVVAAVRDITQRVAAQDELNRVLRSLDSTEDGVFVFDTETLRFSYVNAGAARQVGYSRDELLTMTPMHINPVLSEPDLRTLFAPLITGQTESVNILTTHLRSDGSDIPVEISAQLTRSEQEGTSWLIAISRDISARLEAEERLRESQLALREAEQVLAVADDRERIARDLHDTVVQRLFAAGLSLQATASRATPDVGERLATVIDDLDQTIKDVRTAVFALQSSRPAEKGLRGVLLDVTAQAHDSLGFEPRLQFDGPIETIDEAIAEHLVPVLREALSNVAKHAQADEVRVGVSVGDNVDLVVVDNGVGCPAEVFGGNGLQNLRSRAVALGGAFTIVPRPTGGTQLTWTVPTDTPSSTATVDAALASHAAEARDAAADADDHDVVA